MRYPADLGTFGGSLRLMNVMSPVFDKVQAWESGGSTVGFQRTTILAEANDWYSSALRALNSIRGLDPGWDGSGTPRIDRRLLRDALIVLGDLQHPMVPEPDIVPTLAGGVQLEWSYRGRELEIEFREPGQIGVLRVASNGEMDEQWIAPEQKVIRAYIGWLLTGSDWT